MADEKQTELDELAFDIFAKRGGARGEQDAIVAYRMAQQFLDVRARVRKGELKPAPATGDIQLADACAPNLKPSHPHNLVSQRMGDLGRVNRIQKWLVANLGTNTEPADPDEFVIKLNREFPDLSWDMPTINVARAIFPAYVKA